MTQQYRTGRIKFFKRAAGYGFIAPDSGGKEVHFSQASFKDYADVSVLLGGERVRFLTIRAKDGPTAAAMTVIDREQRQDVARVFAIER